MNLTRFTDYSLRVLIFVGVHRDRLVSIQEVSDAYRISRNHIVKVVHQLGRLGFLDNVRGRKGGIRLAREPQDIRVGDVVRATEPGFVLLECFDPRQNRCAITPACRLMDTLATGLERFMQTLDDVTLQDLLKPKTALKHLLAPRR